VNLGQKPVPPHQARLLRRQGVLGLPEVRRRFRRGIDREGQRRLDAEPPIAATCDRSSGDLIEEVIPELIDMTARIDVRCCGVRREWLPLHQVRQELVDQHQVIRCGMPTRRALDDRRGRA
jgi:hypothetical protein